MGLETEVIRLTSQMAAVYVLGPEMGPRTAAIITRLLNDQRHHQAQQVYALARRLRIHFRPTDIVSIVTALSTISPTPRFNLSRLTEHLVEVLLDSTTLHSQTDAELDSLRNCADILARALLKHSQFSQLSRLSTALTSKGVAPSESFRYQAFFATFRQHCSESTSFISASNITTSLSRVVQEFASTPGADLTPEVSTLLLKETSLVFCRTRDAEEALGVAKAWLKYARLFSHERDRDAPTRHSEYGAAQTSSRDISTDREVEPVVAFAVASGILRMLEHVDDALPDPKTGGDWSMNALAIKQVKDLLGRDIHALMRPIIGVWKSLSKDGTTSASQITCMKLLARYSLIRGQVPVALMWFKKMERLAGSVTGPTADRIQVSKTMRSTYMRLAIRTHQRSQASPIALNLLLGILAQSHHLLSRPYHPNATVRFGRLWRLAFIVRCKPREHSTKSGPDLVTFLETFVKVLRRARVPSIVRQDISGKVLLPFIVYHIVLASFSSAGGPSKSSLDTFLWVRQYLGIPPLKDAWKSKLVETLGTEIGFEGSAEVSHLLELWEDRHAKSMRGRVGSRKTSEQAQCQDGPERRKFSKP